MRILSHHQESPRLSLHGRYYTDSLVHHSCLIDINHSCNKWESSHVMGMIPLASHHIPEFRGSPHKKKPHQHNTVLYQYYTTPSMILKYS